MKYEEVERGQRVFIRAANKKYQCYGTVVAKEILLINGREVERVYIDRENPIGRTLSNPSILELQS